MVSDFINIDCGIPADSNYTDDYSGLNYVSDSGFIDAGESKTIPPAYRSLSFTRQFLTTLRSFPEGTRNCYTIKPVQGRGNRYFIRAWFYYRNYDLKDRLPQFDLHLGVEKWDTILFNETRSIVQKEIIHVPTSDYIHVCFVNTGLGTPFISALDLRYSNRSMYTHDLSLFKLTTLYS